MVGYAAITFSSIAILSVIITLPMTYNYVHTVRRQMHHDMNQCQVSRTFEPDQNCFDISLLDS